MKLCSEPNCESSAKTRGWCSRHYQRWLKTANPEEKRSKRSKGEGTVRKDGYVQIKLRGHPLAGAHDFAFLHRVVLYDTIGPGSHVCHWCEKLVSWGTDLVCDHVDRDRSNNAPDNLVPSCTPCNSARGIQMDKTGCPHDHGPYDKVYANGWRYCSKCKAIKERKRQARIREAKKAFLEQIS